MKKIKSTRYRSAFKWVLWVMLVQVVLFNISAAIHAYRFTHFYEGPPPTQNSGNFFSRTWKIFTGPKYYRLRAEMTPAFPYTTYHITNKKDSLHAWYSAHDSSDKCVILFHGLTVNKSFVSDEAAVFRNWGYNVLLVDFRAHGHSSGYTNSLGVKETEDIVQAWNFAKSKGNKKIILYGISLGAVAEMRATAHKMVDPQGIIAEMPFENLHNHFRKRAEEVGFPSQPFAFLVTFWAGVENGYNGFAHDAADYATKINCPVLVQWGDKDRFVSRKAITAVFNNLASENKKLVAYAGADHESLYRSNETLWQSEVHAFLQSIP